MFDRKNLIVLMYASNPCYTTVLELNDPQVLKADVLIDEEKGTWARPLIIRTAILKSTRLARCTIVRIAQEAAQSVFMIVRIRVILMRWPAPFKRQQKILDLSRSGNYVAGYVVFVFWATVLPAVVRLRVGARRRPLECGPSRLLATDPSLGSRIPLIPLILCILESGGFFCFVY